MDIFLDSGIVDEFKAAAETGLIDGATTNPSLIAKSGRPRDEVVKEICDIVNGPTHALRQISDHIVVKLPLTVDGLRACKTLSSEGHPCNVTLCFSPNQALLAAKAGAAYISPFIGRLDDRGQDGCELIREIRAIYDNYAFDTRILAASIRGPLHVRDVALAGADVATMPAKVFYQLYQHPLTDAGLAAFLADHAKSNQ
ncbi:MAG: transaldolase family protein [Planctomycetota bacterium]|jgi:transaldolase